MNNGTSELKERCSQVVWNKAWWYRPDWW